MAAIIIVLVEPGGTRLIDGRSRLDALCHVGIKFKIKVIDGRVTIDAPGYDIPAPIEIIPDANFNAYAFVLSTNLHRRHLKNTEKRAIAEKVINAQPALSDRAIGRMTGIDGKTIKLIRLGIANAEFRISDRVETIKAPVADKTTIGAASSVAPKPADISANTVTPVVVATPKLKPLGGPNGFNAEEILEVAQRASAILERPVSAPNRDAARKEILHLIELLLLHKTLKQAA